MLFFIIPAYDEALNLPYLFESIMKKSKDLGEPCKLIVVNDGSTDNTKEILGSLKKKYPIDVINHSTNMNVGQVFRSGFSYALKEAKDSDIIITKEADNTGESGILDRMISDIRSGADIVLASCYAKGGKIVGTTPDRLFLSSIANFLLKAFFPIEGINTYSSFYRAYRPLVLKRAFYAFEGKLLEEKGFASMVEMLIKLRVLPIKISEIPMVLRCDLRKGNSKMNKTETIKAYFKLIARYFISSRKFSADARKRFVDVLSYKGI